MPEGHSTTDKALAGHAGSWGSNPDMLKVYSAPIQSGTPTMRTLSLTMPVVMCSSVNACHGVGENRGIMINPSSAICEGKHIYKSHVWEKMGKKVPLKLKTLL